MPRAVHLPVLLLCLALNNGWAGDRAQADSPEVLPGEGSGGEDGAAEPGETPVVPEAEPAAVAPDDPGRFLQSPAGLRARLSALVREPAPGRPWRVAQLGDSHTEWGLFTGPFSSELAAGGAVSPGFVPPWERGVHPAKIVLSRGWRRSSWRKPVKGGVDGPSGTSAVATSRGASATLKLPAGLPARTRVTAWWDASAEGHFRVTAGGMALRPLDAPAPSGGVLSQRSWLVPEGIRELELVLDEASPTRPFRFCGFTVDRPDARVQFDGLGLGGSVHVHPLRQQRGALEAFLTAREHDLVVVWYGTNSVLEPGQTPELFGRQYEELLALVRRASPGAAVVALGLPDLGWRGKGCRPGGAAPPGKAVRRRGAPGPAGSHRGLRAASPSARAKTAAEKRLERLHAFRRPGRVQAPKPRRSRRPPPLVCSPEPGQAPLWPPPGDACFPATPSNVGALRDRVRAAAAAQGAAFFDLFGYMGEAGGMVRWYCQRPALALPDFVHLSAAGYRHVAGMLAKALREAASPLAGTE